MQITKTYNDLSDTPLTSARRITASFLGLIVFGIFGGLSWVALHQSNVSFALKMVYTAPLLVILLLYVFTVWGNTKLKTLGTALIVPQISIFSIISGLLLIFGGGAMQTPMIMGAYYGILVLSLILVIAMYRSDYRKFPEIAYRNSNQKRAKWWLIVLFCYPIGLLVARSLLYGVIGIGLLMFAFYLCHFESFLLIVARYQPQVAKIMIAREQHF